MQRKKFCCGDKDFHKNSPVQTRRFVAAMHPFTVLLQLVAGPVQEPDLSQRSVAVTCRLVCTDLKAPCYREYLPGSLGFLQTFIDESFQAFHDVKIGTGMK